MAENLTEPPTQLQIHFPPEGMAPLIAQAVADESRKGDGQNVVVTGEWGTVLAQMRAQEITEDVESGRQTR